MFKEIAFTIADNEIESLPEKVLEDRIFGSIQNRLKEDKLKLISYKKSIERDEDKKRENVCYLLEVEENV